MTVEEFVNKVSRFSGGYVFNPYRDVCPKYDMPDAALRRKETLLRLVTTASQVGIGSLWIGRDLGHKGGRRTGIALTDEVRASEVGKRWGVEIPRFTYGEPVSETTATVIWSVLSSIQEHVFLWNVFPFHPYTPGESFSNRSHNARERAIGEEILSDLIGLVEPKRIVAIGNDAEKSAKILCPHLEVVKFRHPSYGGKNTFIEQAEDMYGIKKKEAQYSLL